MNSYALAQRAYAPTQSATKTARGVEYDVIAHVSSRLKRAIKSGDFPALAEALHDNNRLWTMLAADVASPENQLPQELRARIWYLSEFTRQHTSKVMRKKENAVPLLEINAAILRGLKKEGAST